MVKSDFEILLEKIDPKMKRNARIVAEKKERSAKEEKITAKRICQRKND